MRILSIGTDSKVFDAASASAQRMVGYGELVERYDIVARAASGERDRDLSPRVRVYAARASHPALFAVSALLAAARASRYARYDAVTAENPFEVGFAAWLVARATGAAFHLQAHGDFFGSQVWRRERRANRLRLLLARFLARRADGLRVVSERIKNSLLALGVSADRITVSPVQPSFHASDEPKSRGGGLVLFVGRLEPEKDPLLLLQAFAEVSSRYPNARLRFIGDGSLRLRIAGANVEVVPWTDDLMPHYASADVLVVPSRHEGWGRVVVEAAAARLPVVMTDVGCAGEFVKDGESGWVVPVGDAARLAEAIGYVLEHPDEAARRAANLAAALEKFPRDANAVLRGSWIQSRATFESDTRPEICRLRRLLWIAAAVHGAGFLLFLARFGTGGQFGWYVLGSDDLGYLELGKNLWRGIFSQGASPEFLRTPGYPIFLMLLRFIPGWLLILLQQALAVSGAFLWYRLAKRWFPTRWAWWSTALFLAEPVMTFWTLQFTTEALFSVFWFGSLVVIASLATHSTAKRAAAAGALLGAAFLARPIVLLYPAGALLFLLVVARRYFLKLAAAFLISASIVVSPWVARNIHTFGAPLLTVKGVGLQYGEDLPTLIMRRENVGRDEAVSRLRARLPRQDIELPRDYAIVQKVVRDVIREDPWSFALLNAGNLIPFFFGDGYTAMVKTFLPSLAAPVARWNGSVAQYLTSARSSSRASPLSVVFVFGKLIAALAAILALVGALDLLRQKRYRLIAGWLLLTILYFGFTSGTVAYSRYRYPVQPIIYLFAAAGVAMIINKFKHQKST